MKLEQNKPNNSDMSDYEDSDDYESETEENDEEIKSYMDLMDKELQATSLSQSFVKKSDSVCHQWHYFYSSLLNNLIWFFSSF